jgi:hypothetical protein
VGLLAPINLLYAASIVALVVIYLRARSRPTIEVASLMLFEEVPAPVAKSRTLRVDLPFWLEALALAALTLAIAGLYIRTIRPPGHFQRHALIFDLGAGMGASSDSGSRLDEARDAAGRMVRAAPLGDEFSVISYALEAQTRLPMTNDRAEIQDALRGLRPLDVAPRPAALRAALIRARGAGQIEFYTDRPVPDGVIGQAALGVPVNFKQVGQAAANVAIVTLDPGVPKSSQGRCVLRSFAARPRTCELAIDEGGSEIFHSSLIVEPGAEVIVPFGPLPAGGLVHARILTPDALAADNDRYAIAPSIAVARALVLSPEPTVRDDLARLVLAIDPNLIVSVGDPNLPGSFDRKRHYELALLHDCSGSGIDAANRLFLFPEPRIAGISDNDPAQVTRSVALAEMVQTANQGTLSAPVLLGPSRVISVPGWMDATAEGAAAGDRALFLLAALGRETTGGTAVIGFDVRDHLLLDPDREDALVLTIDMLRKLITPASPQAATTGGYAEAAIAGDSASLTEPDGTVRVVHPNEWGQARFRPLIVGHYRLVSGNQVTDVFANYYDASESDLVNLWSLSPVHSASPAAMRTGGLEVRTFAIPLAVLALLALLGESLVLALRARRWEITRV